MKTLFFSWVKIGRPKIRHVFELFRERLESAKKSHAGSPLIGNAHIGYPVSMTPVPSLLSAWGADPPKADGIRGESTRQTVAQLHWRYCTGGFTHPNIAALVHPLSSKVAVAQLSK
jgi:hypothetical protein